MYPLQTKAAAGEAAGTQMSSGSTLSDNLCGNSRVPAGQSFPEDAEKKQLRPREIHTVLKSIYFYIPQPEENLSIFKISPDTLSTDLINN